MAERRAEALRIEVGQIAQPAPERAQQARRFLVPGAPGELHAVGVVAIGAGSEGVVLDQQAERSAPVAVRG